MKKSGAVLLTCAVLAVLVIIGAGTQGAARFTGLRWVPDFTPPTRAPLPNATGLPRDTSSPLPAAHHQNSPGLDVTLVLWIAAAIAVVIAVLLLVRWLARRPARTAEGMAADELTAAEEPAAQPEPAEPSAPVLRRGLRQAIEDLETEREPHDAIVKAWLGLQDAAADAGVRRRAAETPTEFTRRILGRVPADKGAVDALLGRYLHVRFGDHPATAADVALVHDALTTLAASWEAAESARRASASAPPWSRTP